MAESTEVKPLLMEELTHHERIALRQVTHMPGWEVAMKILAAGCTEAANDISKLNPQEDDYERKVAERGRHSFSVNKYSARLQKSFIYHVEVLMAQAKAEQTEADNAVARTFGIGLANPADKLDSVKKVFGIHAAHPPKKTA
jgi:hypothetical protein